MSCIGLIFAHQLHPVFGVMFIGVGYPAADLHFFGGRGDWYDLGATQALLEITQVALQVGQALLVGLIALRRLRGVQGLQFANLGLQQFQALWCDVVGLRADLPFDWLIRLRSGVIFIDECPAHGFLPL
jgi:hypothetical protein